MKILRGPNGCPWDKEQTRETLKPMLIEEAYEVLEALDAEDPKELCEELGDLLFQIIFHSRISEEREEFDIEDVCRRIYKKMVGRHPHVFGDQTYDDSRQLLKDWEELKAAEKKASGERYDRKSLLEGIPDRLPALHTSHQVSAKAARVGFDWPDLDDLGLKLREEMAEVAEAKATGDPDKLQEEIGDLLFTAVNVARYVEIDPETALNRANRKFRKRFQALEKHFADQGRLLKKVELEEMEEVWNQLKESPAT